MSAYLLSVMATVLFCSVLTAILPDGKTTNTIKSITKLTCLLVIISPIFVFLNNFTKGQENSFAFFTQTGIEEDKSFIKYYQELKVNATEDTIESELYENYGIKTIVRLFWESVADTNGEKVKINRIQIRFPDETEENMKNSILIFLKNNYCSEVLIE